MNYSAVTRISRGARAPYQVLCLRFLICFIRFLNINTWDNNIVHESISDGVFYYFWIESVVS